MRLAYHVTVTMDRRLPEAAARGKDRALRAIAQITKYAIRGQLKRGPGSAEPGQPPRTHSPPPNLATISTTYAGDQAVVRPVAQAETNLSGVPLPLLMERGGTVRIRPPGRPATPPVLATYAPHPYLGPGLARALPHFPETLRDLL